jgi:hypothetical protein
MIAEDMPLTARSKASAKATGIALKGEERSLDGDGWQRTTGISALSEGICEPQLRD